MWLYVLSVSVGAASLDELYAQFIHARGNNRVVIANEMMQELKNINLMDSLTLFKNNEVSRMTSMVHYWMSEYYYAESLYDKALMAGNQAETASRYYNDPLFHSDLKNILGIVHIRKGNYADALRYFKEAYQIDKKQGDQERISSDLNSQAAVYLSTKQPEEGLKYITRAITIERKLGHDDCLAIRLGMASDLYLLKNRPDTALQLINEAYRLDKVGGRDVKAAMRLSQKAAVLVALGRDGEAESGLLRAVQVLAQSKQYNSLSICYQQLGELYFSQGKQADALKFWNQALPLCQETGNRTVELKVRHGLWQLLREDNPVMALAHLERYTELSDSLFSQETSINLSRYRIMYRVDELKATNDMNERRLKLLYFCVGVMALLLVACAVLWLRKRRTMKPALTLREEGTSKQQLSDDHGPHNVAMHADRALLGNIVDTIYSHMSQGNLEITSLAEDMGMSASQLRSTIQRLTGETPAAYVMRVRLAYAKRLLAHGESSIGDVAQQCGFQTNAHFTRCFKQQFGITPTQFRRMEID